MNSVELSAALETLAGLDVVVRVGDSVYPLAAVVGEPSGEQVDGQPVNRVVLVAESADPVEAAA